MVKVDLITGFLGAGKTTFIRGYMHYLDSTGTKVWIIENEFGSETIDSEILSEEKSDSCRISDLTGMCMCCVGKQEFIYLLTEAAGKGIDRVIVEPSGIYDVDEFFDVMMTDEVSEKCEIGTIITIADAQGNAKLTKEARYLMFAQLLSSGSVLLSKIKNRNQSSKSIQELELIMREFGWEYGISAAVFDRPWDELTDDDYKMFSESGFNRLLHDRMIFDHNDVFASFATSGKFDSLADLRGKLRRLFRFAGAGSVFRVKGTACDREGNCYRINCTPGIISIEKGNGSTERMVVIGQKLNRQMIEHLLYS